MYEEFQNCFSPKVEYHKLRHLQRASGEPLAAPAGSLFVERRLATVEYLTVSAKLGPLRAWRRRCRPPGTGDMLGHIEFGKPLKAPGDPC